MMQTKQQPDLTLSALKQAVETEHTNPPSATTNHEQTKITENYVITATTNDGSMYHDLPLRKRPRLNNSGIKEEIDSSTTDMELTNEITRTHVVTASDVMIEENSLLDIIQNI